MTEYKKIDIDIIKFSRECIVDTVTVSDDGINNKEITEEDELDTGD